MTQIIAYRAPLPPVVLASLVKTVGLMEILLMEDAHKKHLPSAVLMTNVHQAITVPSASIVRGQHVRSAQRTLSSLQAVVGP
mmetsp:Transcript_31932/g.67944  ORF Transcript_31932/g.67944 Transcript_31932/m.67944 type:complete len:82 (+) Transcript_31932:2185-2430(+)